MTISIRSYCVTLSLVITGLMSACVSVDMDTYPKDWSRLRPAIEDLSALEGTYANEGIQAGGSTHDPLRNKLWFFLTHQNMSSGSDATVTIVVKEPANMEIELIEKGGRVIQSDTLKEDTDFTRNNGNIVVLRGKEEYTGMSEVGPISLSMKFLLRQTMDGGLVGKTSGFLATMCLCLIPAGGYGTDLNYWKRIESIQAD